MEIDDYYTESKIPKKMTRNKINAKTAAHTSQKYQDGAVTFPFVFVEAKIWE